MPLQALDTNDVDTDIDGALEALTETTKAALTKQAAEMKRLEEKFEKLEAKKGRPGAANDNFSHGRAANDNHANPDLVAEKKALSDYVRSGEVKTMSSGSDPD